MQNVQKEWNSLYNASAIKVYNDEEVKPLQNVKMLMHILALEFSKIQNELNSKYDKLKTELNVKANDFTPLTKPINYCTINESPDIFHTPPHHKTSAILSSLRSLSPELNKMQNPSPIISPSDDFIPTTQTFHSPKITRKKKLSFRKKKVPVSPCRKKLEQEECSSPKRLKFATLQMNESIEKSKIIKDYKDTHDNSTIVDVTPEHQQFKKSILQSSTKLFNKDSSKTKSKLHKSVQGNHTLTQMYEKFSANKQSQVYDDTGDTFIASVSFDEGEKLIADCDRGDEINDKHGVLKDFVKNYDKVPEKQFFRGDVVRGNARFKLNAHTCKDCEKMFRLIDDDYEREKLINKCSRHRKVDNLEHHENSDAFRLDWTVRNINDTGNSTCF